MELNGPISVFIGGALGALLLELIKIAAWRDGTKLRYKYTSGTYIISTIALFIVAGIVAILNGVEHVSLLRAAQLGINAPAIVAGYASASVARQTKKRANAIGLLLAKPGPLLRISELLAW
jgi:hypothetical protein